jgi:hypothetical protein
VVRIAAVLALVAALAAPGVAEGATGVSVGAAEDSAKAPSLAIAKVKMDLAKLAGMDAIRLTAQWKTGKTEPTAAELAMLKNAVDAADLDAITVYLSVYPFGSSVTPRTAAERADFVAYATAVAKALPTVKRFIVGNEPNLNRFWMPQFSKRGVDVAAPAYERMLAQTYDALKAVSPTITVIGGAVSPRGNDSIMSKKHSPTTFIRDLGLAYRNTGRTSPIMDAFSLHPYQDNSSIPPGFAHPRTTTISLADYPKLVDLLGTAFDGTGQEGSELPIVYDEFGVQSKIPSRKTTVYAGRAPRSDHPVSEAVQGTYYAEALAMAACQPTVKAILLFHVSDEPDLDRWQSGVFYADDTPKSSMPVVQRAIRTLQASEEPNCTQAGIKAFATRSLAISRR